MKIRVLNMEFKKKFSDWYRGKYIPPPKNKPNSLIVRISPGHYEKPLLANLLGILFKFLIDHWEWIIGTMIAVIALILQFHTV
jgi:hypothetical protein